MIPHRLLARVAVLIAVSLCFGVACIPTPLGGITPAGLARLRQCESTGNYRAVNPSGVDRGAYQFDRKTWNSVASRHWPAAVGQDPIDATVEEQDALARWLWSERGRQPWPHCGKKV